MRDKLFLCYSHEDKTWFDQVHSHLKPLQLTGIDIWSDEKIRASSLWRDEIDKALSSAKVAIALVSPAFIGSEFITTKELPTLLLAHKNQGLTFLPILVRPVKKKQLEKLDLEKFQFPYDINTSLSEMDSAKQDRVLNEVLEVAEEAFQNP